MVNYITESPFMRRYQQNREASQAAAFRDTKLKAAQSELDAAETQRRTAAGLDRAARSAVQDYYGGADQGGQAAPMQGPSQSAIPTGQAQASGMTPQAAGNSGTPAAAGGQGRAPGGFRSTLARRYAEVPGGGAAAAEMTLAELDRQQKVMEQTFKLAVENPDTALAWAEQQGMPVPPACAGSDNTLAETSSAPA